MIYLNFLMGIKHTFWVKNKKNMNKCELLLVLRIH
jgi:hypothetical protein